MEIAGDLCITSKATAHRSIHRVIKALVEIKNEHIFMPDENQFADLAAEFEKTAGFPGVIGCVDGTHVPIYVPMNDISETFRCRKGFFSLNVQMVCGPGPSCEVFDIDASWPESGHDATVWARSDICAKIRRILPHQNYHFFGDSGYPLETYLMVPYKMAEGQLKRNTNKIQFEFKLI